MRTKKLESYWEYCTGNAVYILKNKHGLYCPRKGCRPPKSAYIIQTTTGEVINYFSNLKKIEIFLKEIVLNKNYFI